ncbi:phosphatidylethanolamine N-methyltransferase family domain-containing protein [Ketobacter alkanivorans]|uniref:3-oxo-5-alpha-steroid 4-dehydrogenase n=1 Tax=Ketobacter alkanivorans TaxID=1917421 RepID=A0A2K9LJ19_9GAMM|nr:methyltransferase [Ketobacter alkanivorans]AUM12263.1 3-oxo-5-alpha-steroid 4-dehydrogenase [Ketobacter alkanivorans]
MTDDTLFNGVLLAVFASALATVLLLSWVNAPYGRHQSSGWGPTIPVRLGWVLMESPASLVFFYFYFTGQQAFQLVPLLLMVVWQLHYMHRSFIYPFQIRVKPGARTTMLVIALGSFYCGINGYLNGTYLSHYANHLTVDWLTDPRFILGVMLFGFGYYLNKRSDRMLRELREQNPGAYQIPRGFGFNWVSMPNYLGEIITWSGFALASWSLAGLSFVLFTMANLVPRALANHRWYRETFSDYPRDRKAIIPYIL